MNALNSTLSRFRDYRFSTLLMRTFRFIFAAVALPLITAILAIYVFSGDILNREILVANTRALDTAVSVSQALAVEMQSLAIRLSLDEGVSNVIDMGLPLIYDDYIRAGNIVRLFQMNRSDALFDSIALWIGDGSYVLSSASGAFRPPFLGEDAGFHEAYALLENNSSIWQRRNAPPSYGTPPQPMLTLYRRVSGYSRSGLLAISVRESRLFGLLGGVRRDVSGGILLVGEDGMVLYDTEGQHGGQNIRDILGTDVTALDNRGTLDMPLDGEHKMISYADIGSTDWKCIQIVPHHTYTARLAALRGFVIVSVVFGFIISAIVAFALSVRLTRPIEDILMFIDKPDLNARAPVDSELSRILMHLVSVYDENKQLEEEMLNRFSALKNAQARVLQAQITPHFLHNTLQAVQWQVLRETGREDGLAVTSLVRFAELARETMDSGAHIATLDAELKYADNYMALLRLRYGDTLVFCVLVPDDLRSARVPRLSLQPLLENAVEHGVAKKGGGVVRVRALSSEGSIRVIVEDDGVGMVTQMIDDYNVMFERDAEPLVQHIGLGNLHQRLRLLFGEKCGLRLYPSALGGIAVEMRMAQESE